ncbi:hypothetical protein [Streptomyces sp. NPDC005231]|uniref:hypothetical protein n=1 Tax=Streptomyces sp. NPDC005231 TaxID=3157026 RepID=UPI0033A28933
MASPLTHLPGDDLHTYEPPDLDDMSPRQAVDAVTADIRDHRITADDTGLFNVTRHVGLLCHLAARMAANTEYQLAPNSAGLPPAEKLAASAGHLGRPSPTTPRPSPRSSSSPPQRRRPSSRSSTRSTITASCGSTSMTAAEPWWQPAPRWTHRGLPPLRVHLLRHHCA